MSAQPLGLGRSSDGACSTAPADRLGRHVAGLARHRRDGSENPEWRHHTQSHSVGPVIAATSDLATTLGTGVFVIYGWMVVSRFRGLPAEAGERDNTTDDQSSGERSRPAMA